MRKTWFHSKSLLTVFLSKWVPFQSDDCCDRNNYPNQRDPVRTKKGIQDHVNINEGECVKNKTKPTIRYTIRIENEDYSTLVSNGSWWREKFSVKSKIRRRYTWCIRCVIRTWRCIFKNKKKNKKPPYNTGTSFKITMVDIRSNYWR